MCKMQKSKSNGILDGLTASATKQSGITKHASTADVFNTYAFYLRTKCGLSLADIKSGKKSKGPWESWPRTGNGCIAHLGLRGRDPQAGNIKFYASSMVPSDRVEIVDADALTEADLACGEYLYEHYMAAKNGELVEAQAEGAELLVEEKVEVA